MRWPDSLDIGNILGGLGSSSAYQMWYRDNVEFTGGFLILNSWILDFFKIIIILEIIGFKMIVSITDWSYLFRDW